MEINPKKIFVGNLPFSATNGTLESLFRKYGQIDGVKIVRDRATDRPKGFGFVTFDTEEAAQAAITGMNGVEIEGRALTVKTAAVRGTGPLSEFEEDSLLKGMKRVKKGEKMPGWGNW